MMGNDTAIQKSEKQDVISATSRGLQLQSMDDMWRFAVCVSKSSIAPKGMNNPETIFTAVQMGLEVGLTPMQSLQNIAVINGRPTIWGDALTGLAQGSGKCEFIAVEKNGKSGDEYGYIATTKRKGNPKETTAEFTIADAKKAGLWGKSGPWTQYPDRMLLNRARSFCIRDAYPDVIKGLYTVAEMREVEDGEYEVVEEKKSLADIVTAKADEVEVDQPEDTEDADADGTQPIHDIEDELQGSLGF